MAEIVVVEGQTFKKRSPVGVWALSLITFGIYGAVWYYKTPRALSLLHPTMSLRERSTGT